MRFLLALLLLLSPAVAAPTKSVQWGYDTVDPHAVQYKVGATWFPIPLFTVANTWAQLQTFTLGATFNGVATFNSAVTFNADITAALHYLNSSGVPVASTCGTSPIIGANSNNFSGAFTTGTGAPTACTITFANAYPAASSCAVSPANEAAAGSFIYISAQSASAFTVSFLSAADSMKYQYVCGGQ